jgi:hypothetical protein
MTFIKIIDVRSVNQMYPTNKLSPFLRAKAPIDTVVMVIYSFNYSNMGERSNFSCYITRREIYILTLRGPYGSLLSDLRFSRRWLWRMSSSGIRRCAIRYTRRHTPQEVYEGCERWRTKCWREYFGLIYKSNRRITNSSAQRRAS